jgi:hypothetical protein
MIHFLTGHVDNFRPNFSADRKLSQRQAVAQRGGRVEEALWPGSNTLNKRLPVILMA